MKVIIKLFCIAGLTLFSGYLFSQITPDTSQTKENTFTLDIKKEQEGPVIRRQEAPPPKQEKVKKAASQKHMMGLGSSFYDLNKKVMLRTGSSFFETINRNDKSYRWLDKKAYKIMPLAFDYGVSDAFTLGFDYHLSSCKGESFKWNEKYESKESSTHIGFNIKYYFKVNSFTLRPYSSVGISYIRVKANVKKYELENEAWKQVPHDGSDNLYFGFLGKVGLDYYFIEKLGIGVAAGFDLAWLNFNIVLKL